MTIRKVNKMKSSRLIWFKKEILPVEQAMVNILSPTSQFGANVFEGLRAYWCDQQQQLFVFRLNCHISRLLKSVKMMRLDIEYDKDFLFESVLEVIRANKYKEDIAIRQTIFLEGDGSWMSSGPADMFIAPIPKKRAFDKNKGGFHCCVSSWERINDNSISPRIKVGANYINSRMGQIEAVNNGFDSTIFLNSRGTVSEGPGSCLFIVRDGVLITPPLTASVLESITRFSIIDIAKDILNIEVVEREIDRTELYIADEVFFCGTAVEIIPILSVDRYCVGDGVAGSVTSALQDVYFETVRGLNEYNKDWLVPVYEI
ncbi:Branched-chain-amino-acid aminotransferase [Vibrio chagasii]|nr:Branched-chain-amino-acid aminotransferase [Vibrio chagasii]CAH6905268.1 Branched-chain-amino-acid aminotransferase [Vibrio chagasii]CAH6990879.1 Branched-chain-amino-acid aminotransferase [Vibrio chagasii]CAH7014155.1 Branched-chain-amino-acid aminotransferase [Vibrio chagasii]